MTDGGCREQCVDSTDELLHSDVDTCSEFLNSGRVCTCLVVQLPQSSDVMLSCLELTVTKQFRVHHADQFGCLILVGHEQTVPTHRRRAGAPNAAQRDPAQITRSPLLAGAAAPSGRTKRRARWRARRGAAQRRCSTAAAASVQHARLRPWTFARRQRGTFRGTTRRIIPAQLVPSVRLPVSSVQLARAQPVSTLLVNGRSSPSDPGSSQQARLAFFVVAWRDKRDIVSSSSNFRTPNRRLSPYRACK